MVVDLPEEDYRKVLLVKTVVDIAPELLSSDAVNEAELALKGENPPEHSLVPMSEVLLDHLPSAYRRLASKSLPWPRLRLAVPLLALLVGNFEQCPLTSGPG